jgi:Domain of unknown function (DUF1707)
MNDDLRVSDADRDRAASLLQAHFAAGRLTVSELHNRLGVVVGAVTAADLRRALAELPGAVTVSREDRRLEDRYRRLLAFYPRRYRRVHGEEMVAVLMTAAAPGQTRPGLAEAADLTVGALRVWCQPSRARNAVAVAAAGAVLGLLAGVVVAAASPPLRTSQALVIAQPPAAANPETYVATEVLIADSPVILRSAAHQMGSAMSMQALARDVQVTAVTDHVLAISVHAANGRQAEKAVTAVARSYISYTNGQHADAGTATLLQMASRATGPSLTAQILKTSGIGALIGAVLAAIGALIVLSRPRRRIRIT